MKKPLLVWTGIGIIVAAAVFLRFFRLEDFSVFLADNGRDAIIMKRLITLESLPAIGPPSSVGGILLGPFYYYLVAPFLLLTRLDPVGMIVAVAFFSLVGAGLAVWLVNRELGKLTALLFSLFIGFSAVLIGMARFAWNPNLLIYSSFLTLYFFYGFIKSRRKRYYAVLTGLFFGMSLQFHALAMLILPSMAAFALLSARNKANRKELPPWQDWIVMAGVIVGTHITLLYHDLVRGFPNIQNLVTLFTRDGGAVHAATPFFSGSFPLTLLGFLTSILNYDFYPPASFKSIASVDAVFIILLGGLLAGGLLMRRRGSLPALVELHLLNTVCYLTFFSFMNVPYHLAHYYNAVYLSFFLVAAFFLNFAFRESRLSAMLVTLCLFIYFSFQATHYNFLFSRPEKQIEKARQIAQNIKAHHPRVPYKLDEVPLRENEPAVRYFLEIYNFRPLDYLATDTIKELVVMCPATYCRNMSIYNRSLVKNGKVTSRWEMGDLVIFKVENNPK